MDPYSLENKEKLQSHIGVGDNWTNFAKMVGSARTGGSAPAYSALVPSWDTKDAEEQRMLIAIIDAMMNTNNMPGQGRPQPSMGKAGPPKIADIRDDPAVKGVY